MWPDMSQRTAVDLMFGSYLQEALCDAENKLRSLAHNHVDSAVVADLLRHNTELNLVNRLNAVLVSSLELEQASRLVLKEIVHCLHGAEASLWLVDEPSSALVCAQSLMQSGEPVADVALAPWRPLLIQAAHSGRRLVMHPFAAGDGAAGDGAEDVSPPFVWAAENGPLPAFACAPLRQRETLFGVLLLVYTDSQHPDDADLHILESIAAALAAVFENADLYRKAQQLAVLQERQRLAVILHEAINQSLFSAGLIAEVLPRLIKLDPVQAAKSVQDLQTLLRGAVVDLRNVLTELQASAVSHVSFDELLRQLAAGYTGRTGTTVAVNITGKITFPPAVQDSLHQLCREAFTNIAKHAEATQVWVELAVREGGAAIIIRDNGCGLDFNRIPPDHFGLAMMQQQAARAGARLHITSEIGQGTEISIFVPDGGS